MAVQNNTQPFISRSTLQFAFYMAIALVVITLTGVFRTFARREVIQDQLTLASAFLYIALFSVALFTAMRARQAGTASAVVNGVIGGVMAAAGIAALTVFSVNVDISSFIFRNLGDLHPGAVTFNQESLEAGLAILLGVGAGIGAAAGVVAVMPSRLRNTLIYGVLLTITVGILQNQINKVITLSESVMLVAIFVGAYGVARRFAFEGHWTRRALIGAVIGLVIGGGFALIVLTDGLARGSILRGAGAVPIFLELVQNGGALNLLVFFGANALIGASGALLTRSPRSVHNGAWYFVVMLLVLGALNLVRDMTLFVAVVTFVLIALVTWFMPPMGLSAESAYYRMSKANQRGTNRVNLTLALVILLVVPIFTGQSISNTLNLVMLYVIMGVGLNVMVGFTGLLNLGFVASFAFGAYATGILTAPGQLTCGGLTASQVIESGQKLVEACQPMSFWAAVPFAMIVSVLMGIALGVPVLRLRGDYLAIVTLGFGEIVNRVLKSDTFKDLLGGPQGISPIPVPVINLSGILPQVPLPVTQVNADILPSLMRINVPDVRAVFSLTKSTEIYYLYLAVVILVALVVLRLINTRIGRAWRAVREDEDVAEAMGIHLVWTKILAFGVASALAGFGGAVYASSLQGIFPDSFTLIVSINVLSIIIIGGLGSIPGVFIGSAILVGMPEILRELQDYRLLVFGVLLVITMILKPQGLLPPEPPRLAQDAADRRSESDAARAPQLQGAMD